jgi:hypothetical protein
MTSGTMNKLVFTPERSEFKLTRNWVQMMSQVGFEEQ